jgi:hypothetical protein
MAKTLRESFITALEREGEKQVIDSRSTNYATMTRKQGGFYFIGKSGAVRYGDTSSESYPVSKLRKYQLLCGILKHREKQEQSATLKSIHVS